RGRLRKAQHRDAEGPIGQLTKYELVINKTARTTLFWRFPKTTQSRYTDSNALKRSPSAMRLGWRAVTGVNTVQSECGILATAKPAPLKEKPRQIYLGVTSSASILRNAGTSASVI